MKNAIIYTRVSTDEQASKGFSLPHQKSVLELFCAHKGYQIMQHFQEDYSAKDFERPEFKKLMIYVKANRSRIDLLLFTRWDRFSRNIEEAYRMIREFRGMGVEVNSIEQPLDLTQPDSKVMLAVYLVIPEVENDKNSIRTKEGMRRAMKEGSYMGNAPIGYLNSRNEQGKATIIPHPELAPVIKSAFEMYSMGTYSTEDVRKKFYKSGLKLQKNGFIYLLKNPIYIGKIIIPEWKKEPKIIVEGLHQGIVDFETFEKVQKVFVKKLIPSRNKTTIIDENLPLRGFLLCPDCGRTLTGSASKGRNGILHYYYHCNPPCKVRYKAFEVNNLFEKLLSEFEITEDIKELYKSILRDVFKTDEKEIEIRKSSLERELSKLETNLNVLDDKFIDNELDMNSYNRIQKKLIPKIEEIKHELNSIKDSRKDFEYFLEHGLLFLKGINFLYGNASVSVKRQIIGSIFSEKLIFEKTKYRTAQMDEYLSLILLNIKDLQLLKIEKPVKFDGLSSKAPPLGLEPRTL